LKKIGVFILNFNGEGFLRKFLPNVILRSEIADVYVIDNASTDGSLAYLRSSGLKVKIIELKQNLGYAGGYNEGLKDIDHETLVLLNSDVEVSPNWLEPISQVFDNEPNIVAAQPKILAFDDKSKFEYAGASGGYLDKLGYAFCRGRIFDTCETDTGQYDSRASVFWATGACLFIKNKIFKKLGGFDATFFAHMEEIDLCWRIQNLGHEIICEPRSVVYHVGAGTLKKESSFKTYLNYRNNLAMLFKNLPSHLLFQTLFFRLILDGVSAFKFLAAGQFSLIMAILKAHFGFYAMLPSLYKNRSTSFLAQPKLYKKSIVWAYFAQNKKHFKDL
jgi:GT2 family glycosyltransferase